MFSWTTLKCTLLEFATQCVKKTRAVSLISEETVCEIDEELATLIEYFAGKDLLEVTINFPFTQYTVEGRPQVGPAFG